jgi:hypothetical protein
MLQTNFKRTIRINISLKKLYEVMFRITISFLQDYLFILIFV